MCRRELQEGQAWRVVAALGTRDHPVAALVVRDVGVRSRVAVDDVGGARW